MRAYVLYIVVVALSIYAWKDWFMSLCGLVVLMAVLEHPDMPRTMFGVMGLNVWNMLFGVTALAWAANRRREGLTWDMPRHMAVLLLMYLGVIVVGVVRAALDPGQHRGYPVSSLINDELITTIKWVLPGLLLFDGCRNRRRVVMTLVCLLAMYFLFSAQVVLYMPPQAAISDSGVMDRARVRLTKDMGYAATDLSVMLAGACWGVLAAMPLVRAKRHKLMILAGAGVLAYGQAQTGGRAGYVAWGATGLVLCLIKWRKQLILAPAVAILLPMIFPGAAARMLEGFGQTDAMGRSTVDGDTATSGRVVAWPYVIDKIGESPWMGYGRLAMLRAGVYQAVEAEHPGTEAPHPHNMYLETLLDNGILGSVPILLFWATTVAYSARLFRSSNHLYSAVGGLSLALVLTSLFGGIGGQHFYPQEHTLGIWAAAFLSLRVHSEEKQAQLAAGNCDNSWGRLGCIQP